MPQWDSPYTPPYSIYQCERPYAQAPQLIKCKLRQSLKSPNHIRLLKVHPPGWPDRMNQKITREEDAQIQCDVFQVDLAIVTTKKRPYFATLSYVWGDLGVTHEIRCGKESTSVTSSLYEALVHIRNSKTPRLLWVDSLCIDQRNEQEKGQQVQRMHLIYGQSHCISWLGAESDDRDDLQSMLPLMRWLGDTEDTFRKQHLRITWEAVEDYLRHQPQTLGFQSLRQIPWATLHRCVDRKVFKRIWCVQEILIARSNDIRTSKSHLGIAVLARFAQIIMLLFDDLRMKLQDDGQMFDKTGCSWHNIESFRELCRSTANMLMTGPLPCLKFKKHGPLNHTTAYSIAAQHFWKECSDPRDHIYGLAALCKLGRSYRISYTTARLSIQDVFIDFTLHCVRTTKSLEAFRDPFRNTVIRRDSIVDLDLPHRTWTLGLPSWCADLASPRPRARALMRQTLTRKPYFKACKGRSARLTTLSRQRLGVIGVQVGIVQDCSSMWRGLRPGEAHFDYSSYEWAHMASVQRCISSATNLVPPKSLWKLYLDVRSTGVSWGSAHSWAQIAHNFPPRTRHRMVKSSIGAAWMTHHLPEFALAASLSPNRKLGPKNWELVAHDVDVWIFSLNYGTRMFITDNAKAVLGTGPEGLCVGDVVCVLFGGQVPFILRPNPDGNYTLIGECYVSGIMHGEALDMGLEEREFLLV